LFLSLSLSSLLLSLPPCLSLPMNFSASQITWRMCAMCLGTLSLINVPGENLTQLGTNATYLCISDLYPGENSRNSQIITQGQIPPNVATIIT
jgi:hypothetical protein